MIAAEEVFCPQTKEEWRNWLERNGQRVKGIWLIFPHKGTGLPGITYVDALEEALCFGWIDGMVKRYDTCHRGHRFSPRAKNSQWSEVNKQHVRLLIEAGKMAEEGMAVLPDLDPLAYVHPPDILEALRRDGEVWKNFCNFPRFYQNIRIATIDRCRRSPALFEKTLQHFLEKTRKNQRYGRFT
jgi:hypothetical protein